MATTSADIQTLIDAKRAALTQIIARIAEITASPKPDYSIDGQTVSWRAYLDSLISAQQAEVQSIGELLKLMNIIAPYQFQSSGGR